MERCYPGRATMALAALLGAAGCAPLALWLSERDDPPPAQVVEALPAFYDPAAPLPPYAGPHPRRRNWQPDPRDFPVRVGEVGPVDRDLGPLQYPFACRTVDSRLGQPVVDNHQGWGTPVYRDGAVAGYSMDCGVPTRIDLYYKPVGRDRPLRYDRDDPPDDVDTVTLNGVTRPLVLRVERGTINRYIYVIAMLTDPDGPADAHLELWNRRLVYHFRGGVGIGKQQGRASVNTAVGDLLRELGAGYAVAFSTGTYTGTHYDMLRAGRTAIMVKAQFRAAYGEPELTIGVGASGGAVQQLLAQQNHPGLLDGAIPVYGYPDMISQTNWALDCELLEHYFDVVSGSRRWRDQRERSAVLGLVASNRKMNPFNAMDRWARIRQLRLWRLPGGGTECALAWRGLTPLTDNPRYTPDHARYATAVLQRERWSHWHDARLTYGVGEDGFALRTWSNAGVQYGLLALRAGRLSAEEFLHLNAAIGSWKPPREMEGERYWHLSGPLSRHTRLAELSIWSAHNMTSHGREVVALADFAPGHPADYPVAPRRRADPGPVAAAFRGGQVFLGHLDVPTLDVRHYLDPELDMHHSFASVSVRARLTAPGGRGAHHHVIWIAGPGHDFTAEVIPLMDRWLSGGRPEAAEDTCFDRDGTVLARGSGVWDGAWNGRPEGACSRHFPLYRSPRNAAGEPMTGDVFRCALVPVAEFAGAGGYGNVDMAPYLHHLQRVFSAGVCDYARPEPDRPSADELLGM